MNNQSGKGTVQAHRLIDTYSKKFSGQYTSWQARVYAAFLLLVLYLGLLGVAWVLPFPKLEFLRAYNGYFNWASFVIAGLIYFWLKQSAVTSYVLFFTLFALSFIVSKLQPPGSDSTLPLYISSIIIPAILLFVKLKRLAVNYFMAVLLLPVYLLGVKENRVAS